MTDFDFHIPQRAATFEFEVLDLGLHVKDFVEPDIDSVCAIENSTTRPIKRMLRGFRADPGQLDRFDPITDRIRPVMVMGGVRYPMGVFLFNDGSTMPHTYGSDFTGSMVDQGLMINDQLPLTFGLVAGASISGGIETLLQGGGITPDRYQIDAVTGIVGRSGVVWPSGTVRSQAINDLCAMLGCFPVYFDNTGIARVRVIDTDLMIADPALSYDIGVNIEEGSIIDTDTAITAPNRFVVTDTNPKSGAISGIYDLPPSAPQSEVNIGYFRTQNITEQGLLNNAAAEARAYAAALVSLQDARWVTFSGPIDPRHDTFEVVRFEGEPFRETGWSTDLTADASMRHDLRRIWSLA